MDNLLEEPSDGYYGVTEVGDTETDYQLCTGILDLTEARNDFWKFQYQYQQNDVCPNSCTIVSAVGAFSDLTGTQVSIDLMKGLVAQAKPLGFNEKKGWSVKGAVDLIQTWGSTFLNEDLTYYKVFINSDEYWDVINKGYSVMTSYKGNASYGKDKNADGDLDNTTFGKATYSHCIRHVKSEGGIAIPDNYPKTAKKNIYTVPKANIADLLKNKVFGDVGYVFCYKKDAIAADSELWKRIPLWAKKSYEKAVKAGVILDISNPMKVVGDSNLEKMYIRSGTFIKEEGKVTEARAVVALDRQGLLDKLLKDNSIS
jgi:hypothetical protein